MKKFHIKNGLTLTLACGPKALITPAPPVMRVAWKPPANVQLDAEVIVALDEMVSAGDPLLIDKNSPLVKHVAPSSGKISEIVYHQGNLLSHIVIELNDSSSKTFDICKKPYKQQSIKKLLLESGLWTHIHQRPFDVVPAVDYQPTDILVTAIDTRPSAPDPQLIIEQQQTEFNIGLEALSTQATKTLWVCQAMGSELAKTSIEKLETVIFAGPHPAGLPSLHMQKLGLADVAHPAWHIDYQDVIALGSLLISGILSTTRVISLSGDQIRNPRLMYTPIGANVSELIGKETINSTEVVTPIVGSILTARTTQWLDKFDRQISVMGKILSQPAETDMTTSVSGKGFVAEPIFEHINAFNLLPIPLLRALMSQDYELAEQLGCLELIPEDLDVFNHICSQGNNYSDYLHACNQTLMEKYTSGLRIKQHVA